MRSGAERGSRSGDDLGRLIGRERDLKLKHGGLWLGIAAASRTWMAGPRPARKDETDVALQYRTGPGPWQTRLHHGRRIGCLTVACFCFFPASAYGFSFFYSYKGHDGDCVTLLIPIPAHLHYPSRQEDHLSHSHRSGQLTWLSCANLYSRANYTLTHTHTVPIIS
jgi:hypothetical protein